MVTTHLSHGGSGIDCRRGDRVAKLHKKNKSIHRRINTSCNDAQMLRRAKEGACLRMIDDMRIVFAYSAHNRLGYGKKRLERIESLCNDYLTAWRKDPEATIISELVKYAYAIGYNHHEFGSRVPFNFSWSQYKKHLPKYYRQRLDAEQSKHNAFYATNTSKIVPLFIICSLDQIRRDKHDISKKMCLDMMEYFILDLQCIESGHVTFEDMEMVLKEECNYTYGQLENAWQNVIVP